MANYFNIRLNIHFLSRVDSIPENSVIYQDNTDGNDDNSDREIIEIKTITVDFLVNNNPLTPYIVYDYYFRLLY